MIVYRGSDTAVGAIGRAGMSNRHAGSDQGRESGQNQGSEDLKRGRWQDRRARWTQCG